MPTFETPEQITADIVLVAGSIQVNADDRTDTTVEVLPRDAAKDADVRAAEQIEVTYSGGRLTVREPKGLSRMLSKGMVDVTVELPVGSRVQVRTDYGNFRGEGRLGESRVTGSSGNITLDQVTGNAELTMAHGSIRVEEIDGSAAVKTTTGSITLGTVTGKLTANSAHGDVTAQLTLGSVEVRTTYGNVRIGEVVRGRVDLENSYGQLEIGIREGTAAWLDAISKKGVVRSSLDAADGPDSTEETVQVRVRNVHGDVVVRRA